VQPTADSPKPTRSLWTDFLVALRNKFDSDYFPEGAATVRARPDRFEWSRCFPFIFLHAGCFAVIWTGWSWTAVGLAAALYVFRCLVDDDIPLNAGCLKPLKIVVPAGSMLNPSPPAAVVAGNVETSQHIVDALLAALGVMANSQGTMNNLTFGDAERQYYETICGGAGATATAAGASAVHTHMTNSRLTDPEILERRFPVRLDAFEVLRGSGGPGAQAGGDGARRRLTFLAPMQVALLSTRRQHAPQGVAGGGPARAGSQRLIEASGAVKELAGCFSIAVRPGDAIEIETPGGGGFGPAAGVRSV